MSAELPISGDSNQPESGRGERQVHGPASALPSGTNVRCFGNYELLEEIAHGGMGVVYKARQLAPERIVALKMVLPGQLTREDALNRFRIEGEAAAHLDHPNIVPIYEVGEEEGVPYFSMRLVEGRNLAQFNAECGVRNGEWMRKAAALMSKTARAVHYAHQHGVLHRDLKPSNILLDAHGEPYLTDFGLAKLVTRSSDLTLTGAVVGTPDYMSPEQAQGGAKDVTTASDLFSLGAVFFELLTGQAPFHGGTDLETRRRVVEEEAARPSAINHAVNRDLQTVCLKCLEKNPRRRYHSAGALAQDLERWLRHEPIQARPASPATVAMKWTRRHWAATALAVMALLSLAGYALTTTRHQRQLRLALAESLLHEGEALAANHQPAEAKDRIERSRKLSLETRTTTLPAELSLADIYRFSPPPLMTLRGHRGCVTCVAVSSDGRRLYSGGQDGTIRTWSCPLGWQEAVWDAHAGGVTCLAVSRDGRYCVSGGMDKKIQIWDGQKATLVRTIEGDGQPVSALCFAPEGNTFASASWSGAIRIWRVSSGQECQVIQTDLDRIPRIAFSPDGSRVAAGGERGGLGVWRLDDPGHPRRFSPEQRNVCVAYAPDGDRVLIGNSEGGLAINSLSDPTENKSERFTSAITDVSFLPPGKRAIVGTRNGNIAVFDFAPKDPVVQLLLSEHAAAVTQVAAFADGRLAASSSEDGTIRIWDTLPARERLKADDADAFSSVVFSPDGLLFLSAGQGGQLKLWDSATGKLLRDYVGHDWVVMDAAFSPDGRRTVSCGQDGTIRIWDVTGGTELRRFSLEHRTVCRVGFSADGRLILGGEAPENYPASKPVPSEWFKLHVWEADTGRELCAPVAHRGGVFALGISACGGGVLTGGGDGKLKLWDPLTWRALRSFNADQDFVRSIAFGPTGESCLSVDSQRALRVWSLISGEEIKSLHLNEQALCLSAWTSNSLVLAGMEGGNMRLLDLATPRELHRFAMGNQADLWAVGLTPDGSLGVSSSTAGAMLWRLDRGAAWLRLEEAALQSRAPLQHNAHDGTALRALGEWYQFRRLWDWASELYEQARTNGADVSSLSLAWCYWQGRHFEQARNEMIRAASRKEAPDYYLELCLRAVSRETDHELALKNPLRVDPTAGPGSYTCQPGPGDGKDIWTTSLFGGSSGEALGGGEADKDLRVGGWGDWYYTLLQFDLAGMPTNARSAMLCLYCVQTERCTARLYLDRITAPWDWKTSGTGPDHERLWWADRPPTSPWRTNTLPAPSDGEWYAIDLTGLYNAWQSGACPNYGVQLRPETNSNGCFDHFCSSRYTNNPSFRPKLVVLPQN
jgi:WD40 repeat protein/tRNA A-37 threonylcarbamoyl transferase component Bud32